MSGNPKDEPLHYGEIYAIWQYLSAAKGRIAGYQTLLNHTGDADLKTFIKDKIQNELRPQEQQLTQLLKENGIAIPPSPPERPDANLENIPVGARFNDPEIAMMLAQNIAAGMVACSTIMGQATREDVAMMFGQYHATKAQYGGRLLKMQKEKGWLIPPPLHVQTPELVHA